MGFFRTFFGGGFGIIRELESGEWRVKSGEWRVESGVAGRFRSQSSLCERSERLHPFVKEA